MTILDYIDEDTIVDMLEQHHNYRLGTRVSISWHQGRGAWLVYWDAKEVNTCLDGGADVKQFDNVGEATSYALSPANHERWESAT